MRKKMILLFLFAMLSFTLAAAVSAEDFEPGWVRKEQGYYWRKQDGDFYSTGTAHFVLLGGKKYYVLADGKRKENTLRIGSKRYYLTPGTGVLHTGWLKINGKTYYMDRKTGEALTGFKTITQKMYFFDPAECYIRTGLITYNGRKYYISPDEDTYGQRYIGWKQINDRWMFFNSAAFVGWKNIGTNRFYFDKNGYTKTGWFVYNDKKYYLNPNRKGALVTNRWVTTRGKRYYVNAKGEMVKNHPAKINDQYYFFNLDGTVAVNKHHIVVDGKYYHTNDKGVMTRISYVSYLAEAMLDQWGWNLRSAFRAAASLRYFRHDDTIPKGQSPAYFFGKIGFTRGGGDCRVYACTFYWMAKELGYDAHYVYGYVPSARGGLVDHGWVEIVINGATYVFDPDFTYSTGRNGYMITYGTSGTWRYTNYHRVN